MTAVGGPIVLIQHYMVAQEFRNGAAGTVWVISVYIPPGNFCKMGEEVKKHLQKFGPNDTVFVAGDFNYGKNGERGSREEFLAYMQAIKFQTGGSNEPTNRHHTGEHRLDDIYVKHLDIALDRNKIVGES